MNFIVSKHAGFCFGVKRAVNLTKKNLETKKKIYSLGPLIHNNWVVSRLEKEGLKVINNLDSVKGGYCIIPSHGVDPNRIRRKNISFIDTTCPFVFKAQDLVRKLSDSGYEILILGDKDHPEVKGLVGISKGKAKVIRNKKEAISFISKNKKMSLISQTTQSLENYKDVISKLLEKDFQELRIYNTICKDVIKRQEEARAIAEKSDLVIVIGGENSANTKRLVEICRHITRTCHIEDESDIKNEWFKGARVIGIVTGASTPGEFIGKVKRKIENFDLEKIACEV